MSRVRLLAVALFLAVSAKVSPLRAQPGVPATRADSAQLRVFLDCQAGGCDEEYFQTEIPFADWVRDRQFANIHLLVTDQTTAGGGRTYTVAFLGQRRFVGRSDTLHTSVLPAASDDDERAALVRIFKVGLLRYAAETPIAGRFRIVYDGPAAGDTATRPAADPWKAWVFRVSGRGFMNGESQQSFGNYSGSLSAQRVTQLWKTELSSNASYSRSRFTLQEGETTRDVVNVRHSQNATGRLVRSLSPHLSVGLSSSVSRSDFFNQNLTLRLAPAVEYNYYPWSEATRRQLTGAYAVGLVSFDYNERTILGRDGETRPYQVAIVALETIQPWGSIEVAMRGSSYLHDFERNNLSFGGELELRIARGLSFEIYGNIASVRDQIYLSGEGLSNEEILLQQRALATDYSYFTSVGLSYTFGSIFSTIVNPRLNELFYGGGF